ncbi:MAG TPA: hypothetical protein VMS11_10060, partial [Solirubrobacterales bacterium]|nr:hypothetical protein [Solirubrobacterales bacterium]
MVSFGSYLLGVVELAAVGLSVGFSAYRLRAKLLPSWTGAPARLVEVIVGVALIIWISEILGLFSLLYPGLLVVLSAALAVITHLATRGQSSPLAGGGGAGDAAPT